MQTFWMLRTLPMFAYLPQRGCQDALTRVFLHCKHVREQLNTVKYRTHHSASGASMPALSGGLLLSLDLPRAFYLLFLWISVLLKILSSFFRTFINTPALTSHTKVSTDHSQPRKASDRGAKQRRSFCASSQLISWSNLLI